MSVWMMMLYVGWALITFIYGALQLRSCARDGSTNRLVWGVIGITLSVPPIVFLYQGLQQGIQP